MTPPAVAPEKVLQRSALLERLRHLQAYKKKVITVEAQAGSGKSIFAQQYLRESGCLSGWCQFGPEDQDPVALLGVLVTLLRKTLPAFQANNILVALDQGTIHHSEASGYGAILAEEMGVVASNQRFFLVFDDIHLIAGGDESASLLLSFIRHTPPWVQCLLISRYPVKKVLQVKRLQVPTLEIGSSDLDFSLDETVRFFQSILGLSLSLDQMQKFQQHTEGWITGLVLAGLHLHRTGKNTTHKVLLPDSVVFRRSVEDYFLQDVLAEISQERYQALLQLVLLEEMSTELVCVLFGKEEGEGLIEKLKKNNLFFRCIDEERGIYNFHYLFRETLRSLAEKQLSSAIRAHVFQKAVRYHLRYREPLRALYYAVCGELIPLAEEILSQSGFELLYLKQIKTLALLLGKFSEVTILAYPWLSYYYGACLQDSSPSEALPFLRNAQTLFSQQGNEYGILLSNSQLVEFHTIVDGQFNLMAEYLVSLETVFERQKDSLLLPQKMKMLHALLLALRKKKKEALQAAQESLALRQQVGANAHVLLNHQVLGAAFAQLGMYQEAKEHFAKAMNLSQELGEEFQRCSVLTHRAWMYLQQGEEEQALRDVVHCLHFMKKNEYIHFFSFIPQVVEPILVLALRHSIETDYVLKLLAERFDKGVTPGGTPIPLIDISLLGKTTLSVTENRQQNVYELTEIERHLFFILAASHGLQREHSLISLRLWPDKDAERQRSSLDTLLSQIRKKLGRLVSPVKAKEYLTVERGVVKLKNCRIDVMQFLQHARHGRHCVRQEKHWQACNSFYRAFRFWKGAGLLGLTVEDSELFQQDVEQEFCLSAKIYASLLQEQKKNEQACELLKTVFRHFPQDAELARQLFDLYSRSGNHAQAQHILQHYKQVHQQVSEDALDVEEAMCAFWQEFPDNE
ncbi:MAG: hypothetical protein KKA76_09080 [Proteobacteria bacterium]|nr:hypothetical protein [Pseudomonadota bacterium]